MDKHIIKFVHDVPEEQLKSFFSQAFNAEKADFLIQYSDWWHRDSAARFVALDKDNNTPIGYSSLINSQIVIDGNREDIYWLVDVLVLSAYRGQGIQRQIDEEIKKEKKIHIGFPNELASKIHRKHGWGVRMDGYRWHYTLSLRAVKNIQFYSGIVGKTLRIFARLINPLYRIYKTMDIRGSQSALIQEIQDPNAQELGDIFLQYHPQEKQITTYRDAEFIQWRYLDAPYRSQLRFYTATQDNKPVLVMITRTLIVKGIRTLRILDLFGDLDYTEGLQGLIYQAQAEAAKFKVEELIIVVTDSVLNPVLEKAGFSRRDTLAFCWLSEDKDEMKRIEDCSPYWCFADSDLDYS